MPKRPTVMIVTPIHNGKDHTLAFLNSLREQTYKNLAVIIVDDGSTDGSAEAIKAGFPEVTVLTGDGSLWWSGSTNLGVKRAVHDGADYIFTVNNDVTIYPEAISELVSVASKNTRSLVGSMVVYQGEPDRVWYCGAYFDQKAADMAHRLGQTKDYQNIKKSDWLAGMGVLIPVEAFGEAGLYDERHFPQYFGDADFSLRAKKCGFTLLVNPKAVVEADVQSSWISRAIEKPSWKVFYQIFFSIKSQYHLGIRYRFYRLYWPGNYVVALFKFYLLLGKGFLWPYFKINIKRTLEKILGRQIKRKRY